METPRLLPYMAVTLWLIVVAIGIGLVYQHELSPGAAAIASPSWPRESRLLRSSSLPTLVVLAHPGCPCTRASLRDLERLMTRLEGRVAAHVLIVKAPGLQLELDDADIRRHASTILGVNVADDQDGLEARLFGARTSGETLLYGTDGRLLFTGGITASRGHSGESTSQEAIVSHVTGSTSAQARSPVFGCPLFASSASLPLGEQP